MSGGARRVVGVVAVIVPLFAAATSANAAFDGPRAHADVERVTGDDGYAFCRAPREPLSERARALCPTAGELPGCTAFVSACAKARGETSSARRSLPSWARAARDALGSIARFAVWLFVAIVVVAVLVPIVRAVTRASRRRRPVLPEGAAANRSDVAISPSAALDVDGEALLARADDRARRGDHAAALGLYLAASLHALEMRGALRITRDRSNGEYVRACTETDAKRALSDVVREVDRVQFGGEAATRDVVSRAAKHAAAIVRASVAIVVALGVALLASGCGTNTRRSWTTRVGDDPAGDEVWYDVIRGQGVRAERLERSLASLPIPVDGTYAVAVDVETTELDAQTGDHLLAWVDAGGVLVLAGAPDAWPRALGAASASPAAPLDVTVEGTVESDADDAESDDDAVPLPSTPVAHARLVTGTAVVLSRAAKRIATFADGTTYAASMAYGKGFVIGIASDELMTNVGLARPGNAEAMAAIWSNADRAELRVAEENDGAAPPSSPMASLSRAGLGLGVAHALVASLVLFAAAGARLARPKPAARERRRSFVEHVEAVGALYARAGAARHALATFARFVEERVRSRFPPGVADVPSFLASRGGLPIDTCRRLWSRADAARGPGAPTGDELVVLEELTVAYGMAMAKPR